MGKITTTEKEEVCQRFVVDVLKKRVIKYDNNLFDFYQKQITSFLSKSTLKLIDDFVKLDANYCAALNMIGIDVDSWLREHCEPTNTIDYECDLSLCFMSIGDFGLTENRKITLPATIRIEQEDWQWKIEPKADSKSPARKKWNALEDARVKLEADANTLYDTAMKSIARKATHEAIEKNCPELAPYLNPPEDSNSCDLAGMASCMRSTKTG